MVRTASPNKLIEICYEIKKNKGLFLMLLPTIVYFIIFHYIPMPGAYVAFVDYNSNFAVKY